MDSEKLSISLPRRLAHDVRAAADDHAEPVSTWLADAARRKLRHDAALAALLDYEAEFGVITAKELAAGGGTITTVEPAARRA